MSDEEWIGFNSLDTAGFRDRVKRDFGMEVELSPEDFHVEDAAAAD
jgi:hypothetical protein